MAEDVEDPARAPRDDPSSHGSTQDTEPVWWFPRIWGTLLLVLIGVTHPLWFATGQSRSFPSIPLLGGVPHNEVVSMSVSIALVVALCVVVAAPRRCRSAWWLVAAALGIGFLVDQHRLQPWAYQSAIYALLFASMDRAAAQKWLIPLASSVYIYSAFGKLDFQFAHTVGQDFLWTMTRPIGGLPEWVDFTTRVKLALLLPLAELIAGAGLLVPRTRIAAAVVVMVMHAALIGIFSPFGLDHSNGVLIWNALLLVQAVVLMILPQWRPSRDDSLVATHSRRDPVGARGWLVRSIVIVALFAPLLERRGYWDHWTSWSLYSPHTSRAEIELHRTVVDKIDPSIRRFVKPDADGDAWHELDIEQWSLIQRRVPIYPQARYQLSLAADLAAEEQLSDEIRVRWKRVSDRRTGRRREELLPGREEIQAVLKEFWLTR